MSKVFERRLRLARVVLSKLEPEPMRWTNLLKATLRDCGTPRTYEGVVKWLKNNGYIERPSRGLYKITQKGKDFLKSLPKNREN